MLLQHHSYPLDYTSNTKKRENTLDNDRLGYCNNKFVMLKILLKSSMEKWAIGKNMWSISRQ